MKGQAAVELLAYAAFFLFTFVVAAAVFFQLQAQEISRAEASFAQELAFQLADQINTAFIAGSGFSQSVQIAPLLLGKPYTITISKAAAGSSKESGLVYVNWQGQSGYRSASAPTVTAAYDATPQAGYLWLDGELIAVNSSAGTLNMTNMGGTIRFSKG